MAAHPYRRQAAGFTLTELLVVIGIIALLISMLMPTLSRARAQANLVNCMSRERQLTQALIGYAALNRGKFPPNTATPSPGTFWNDYEILDLRSDTNFSTDTPGTNVGTIFTCPSDVSSVRSYAMNYWASSFVYIASFPASLKTTVAARGTFWNYSVRRPTRMLLLTEAWSSALIQNGVYKCANDIGYAQSTSASDDPASRFGGNGGISPQILEGPWGYANTELAFALHRVPSTTGGTTAPGRVNIAFADGHVSTESRSDLITASGQLSGVAYWSPMDYQGQ